MGFWNGVFPSMWRATILNAVKLGSYDSLKHKIIDSGLLQDGYAC